MKKNHLSVALILILLTSLMTTGCWNYREIDKMAVVAGVAIDRGKEKGFEITVEIVSVTGGRESKTESHIQSTEGDTIFDAVRNQIPLSSKRLYWSHAQVIIVSQAIAEEGMASVLDWYNRDAETRGDVDILVSKEKTAKEILESAAGTEPIKSFAIQESITNHKSLSKASEIHIWEMLGEIKSEGISTTAPTVSLKKIDGKKVAIVLGTAAFKGDKLIGFLDEEDTKALLFVKDKIKGGVLIFEEQGKQGKVPISLEIFDSKTKVRPIKGDNRIEMKIEIDLTVAIDEIQGSEDFMVEEKTDKLEKDTGENLKNQIDEVIKKVQSEFGSDIFGLSSVIHGDMPKEWEKIRNEWDKYFKELKVTVVPKVHIKNSAMLAKPIEIGD